MRIAIVGGKGRESAEDKAFVYQLIDAAARKYSYCTFCTVMTNVGIGSFVKEKCLEQDPHGKFKFQLVEILTRIYGAESSKQDQTSIYLARNATMFELADMLYYFATQERRGTMENLLDRVIAAERPYKIFYPGDTLELL